MKAVPPQSRITRLNQKHAPSIPFRSHDPVIIPGPTRHYLTKSQPYPDPEEEREVTHDAFMQAMEQSKPTHRIPGLQEFAAAVWERKRRIPSGTYNNPLNHIFHEFDQNNDNVLTAEEIAIALQGRGVQISVQQVQEFIHSVDANNNGVVEFEEFERLIFHMASTDLRRAAASMQSQSD